MASKAILQPNSGHEKGSAEIMLSKPKKYVCTCATYRGFKAAHPLYAVQIAYVANNVQENVVIRKNK